MSDDSNSKGTVAKWVQPEERTGDLAAIARDCMCRHRESIVIYQDSDEPWLSVDMRADFVVRITWHRDGGHPVGVQFSSADWPVVKAAIERVIAVEETYHD